MRQAFIILAVGIIVGCVTAWIFAEAYVVSPLKNENLSLKEELNSTLQTLLDIQNKLDSIKKEKEVLENRLFEVESILKAKNEQISQLVETVSKLQSKLSELKSNNASRQGSTTKPVTVILLPDEDYYRWIRSILSAANESIHVAVFSIKYDPKESVGNDPVNYLLAKLVDAKRRGLDVKVVVDDYTYEKYRDTLNYLKREGVQVRLDPSRSTTMHVKLVIVDGKWLFVGSHNWTESALKYNREYSVLIGSETYALKAEEYFENLWRHGRTP